jgi:hypothetical protein
MATLDLLGAAFSIRLVAMTDVWLAVLGHREEGLDQRTLNSREVKLI